MTTRTTINDLDIKTIRKMKEQLVACDIKPKPPGVTGVFFLVVSKKDLRKNLKALGFNRAEINEIMTRAEKVEELD